jgi:branched-chain amino acid transport system ATP-binding protein
LSKWTFERIYELFPGLKRLPIDRAALSGGELQCHHSPHSRAIRISSSPTSLRVAPIIVKVLGEFIDLIKQEGMTVLLSEQNVKFALKHSDRAYIVDNGHIKYQGSIAELEKNEEIKKRYLAV